MSRGCKEFSVMEKEVVELYREKHFTTGYSWVRDPVSQEEVLDALIKFSQERSCKIYKHLIKEQEEEIVGNDCEKAIYLIIYYQ